MTPPDCAGSAKGCTLPPNRGAPAPSPADVTDGVFSTDVRSTYLQQMSGKRRSVLRVEIPSG